MIAVAIDGPAGAGKSTVARKIAKELGFIYVDTGALYRAVGLSMLRRKVNLDIPQEICKNLEDLQIALQFVQGEQRVILCGDDVTGDIRTAEVSMAASKVSSVPQVRSFLFSLQKEIAEKNHVIMDGRDIGTVVLPNAQVKIFLTASIEERAKRRYLEMVEKGQNGSYEEVLADMKVRDYNDSHRKTAPLKPAQDAVLVDTTGYTLEESVEHMVQIIREKIKGEPNQTLK